MKEQIVSLVNGKAGIIAASLHVPVFLVQALLLAALLAADMAGFGGTVGDLETGLTGTLVLGMVTGNISWATAMLRKSILDKPSVLVTVIEDLAKEAKPAA